MTKTAVVTEPFTALPWLLWGSVMALVVTGTTNVTVLAGVAVTCWLTAWAVGGPRAAVTRLVVPVSLGLVAVWVVLTAGLNRGGIGGRVVWLLPEWSTATSGLFGGAVTTGQLHLGAARAVQALAVVAILGLLVRAVGADAWLRLAAVTWGRAARAFGPLLCVGEAYVAAHEDLRRARRSGFATPTMAARTSDVAERARARAEGWFERHAAPQEPRRAVLGVVVALALCLWWATTAIDPAPRLDMTGLERTLVAVALFGAFGLALHGFRVPRPGVNDLVPLVAALIVGGAWVLRDRTGDAEALVVDFTRTPELPMSLLVSLLVLPLLALARGGRQ